MQEIKFKVWDKTKNQWLNIESDTYSMDLWGNLAEVYVSTGELEIDYLKNIELAPYIGVKDIHGKDIHSGDYIRNEYGRVAEVVWFQSPSYIGWDLKAINSEGKIVESRLWSDLEIIGNKYEGLKEEIN